MTAQNATQLLERLQSLKQQRRDGAIDLRTYYRELLALITSLVESLVDEIDEMDESDILLQTPLILLFIEEQIRKFGDRT